MSGRLLALCASVVLVSSAVLAVAGSQPSGASTAAVYGVSQAVTIPVTMDDGVVLSTEVIYPTDPSTSARASGRFPVLLT